MLEPGLEEIFDFKHGWDACRVKGDVLVLMANSYASSLSTRSRVAQMIASPETNASADNEVSAMQT